jgi:hypothetical protein
MRLFPHAPATATTSGHGSWLGLGLSRAAHHTNRNRGVHVVNTCPMKFLALPPARILVPPRAIIRVMEIVAARLTARYGECGVLQCMASLTVTR